MSNSSVLQVDAISSFMRAGLSGLGTSKPFEYRGVPISLDELVASHGFLPLLLAHAKQYSYFLMPDFAEKYWAGINLKEDSSGLLGAIVDFSVEKKANILYVFLFLVETIDVMHRLAKDSDVVDISLIPVSSQSLYQDSIEYFNEMIAPGFLSNSRGSPDSPRTN
jgi:hypothetical protein